MAGKNVSMSHRDRMERRNHLIRKRRPRYHVTAIYDGDNRVIVKESDDLNSLLTIADDKAPAYIIDEHARPAPEVVYVALKQDRVTQTQHYMQTCD